MSQLSRPYQIALGALVVLAIAWFTVLKPSDSANAVEPLPGEAGAPAAAVGSTGPQAPGVAGLTRAVDKAKGAAATSAASAAATKAAVAKAAGDPAPTNAAKAKSAGATGATGAQAARGRAATKADRGTTGASGATGAQPAGAKPGVAAPTPDADPSAPILREVAAGKVAVVLFSSRDATDDRAVRRSLAGADRHGGDVIVHFVSIDRVADYEAITRDIDVSQAPTLLVIGKGNVAQRLVGFTDTRGIDQLVADVGGRAFAPRHSKRSR